MDIYQKKKKYLDHFNLLIVFGGEKGILNFFYEWLYMNEEWMKNVDVEIEQIKAR